MAQQISITKITPFYPRGNYVEWDVGDGMPTGTWKFIVERSESPSGPFTRLTEVPLENATAYFDAIELHTFHRFWYYRVYLEGGLDCGFISKPEAYRTIMSTVSTRIRGEIQKMRYDLGVKLSADSGLPVKVFKKKTKGDRCTECMSSIVNVHTSDVCDSCYSTGIVGGFYAPINTLADITEAAVQEGIDVEGESEAKMQRAMMLDIPLLVNDDLIFEIGTGDLYEVKSVDVTSRRRVVVHQEPTIALIPRSHAYYRLVNRAIEFPLGNEIYLFDGHFRRY